LNQKNGYPGGIPLILALNEKKTSVKTIAFLIDMWPESVREKDPYSDETCLIKALKLGKNVKIIALLFDRWPEAVWIPDKSGKLPLHRALIH